MIIMKKVVGYVISVIGVLALALNVKPVKEKISLPAFLTDANLVIGGLVLIAIGILIIKMYSSSSAPAEVPIYKGKKIVGYRRR